VVVLALLVLQAVEMALLLLLAVRLLRTLAVAAVAVSQTERQAELVVVERAAQAQQERLAL
jgi:hypothetical protein